ncbi:antibiotic biosynthesis monooxygenase [Rhodococcus antarcticus]|uniref:Antibiotic biosynthesis monooxygenase n=1 Tax=Rhodococcus antarcticus TaxID=2987751 RepID=A0ABY6NWE4_9NOCA|nr:putative quinol monooxygenase [Rhodococcus antarcticus]UZJ23613.1 antibiotic biosynthesis monooxygenase [Rhodococcus antarcticus]
MILIVVKFPVRPERAEAWLDLVAEFTRDVRAEEGNLFFEWSRSVDEPSTFVLVEGFASQEAGEAHVATDHFQKAIAWMGAEVTAKPAIIYTDAPQEGWNEMGEVTPR